MIAEKKNESNGRKPKVVKFALRLYVTGQTPRSVRAIENLRNFCGRFLKDRFELQVIDIYQQPELASQMQILAAPTLIKTYPLPVRWLVGDLSNQERMVSGLDVEAA